jgi:outer membrane protein OmpA-like peptidoglycan-associated protein
VANTTRPVLKEKAPGGIFDIMKWLFFLSVLLHSLSVSAQGVLFRDDFVDNRNFWSTSFESGTCGVAEDHFFINKTTESGNYFFYQNHFLESAKEFTVESSMRQVSGIDNNGYGIIWGSNELKDANVFSVTSNGHFSLFKYVNSKYQEVKGWSKIDHVNPMGTYNLLKIHYRVDSTLIYVNNKKVFATANMAPRGGYIGFVVNDKMHVQVDFLELRQDQSPLKQVESNPGQFAKENLGKGVNSKFGEVLPIISADGKTLYFVRKIDTDPYDEILISELSPNNQWGEAVNPGKPLNNAGYNFVISVTPDGNRLLLGNTYLPTGEPDGGGVSTSVRTETGWSVPVALKIENYYNRNAYSEYALSPDGKTLISCIERDDTWGSKDLYVSFLREDDSWTEPRNMGPALNTMFAEGTPFIAADGLTLYYATEGKKGYGSLDIFVSRRLDDSWLNWSEPLNLGPTVNTSAWEAYYTVPARGDFAYLVSTAETYTDIFRLKLPEAARPKPIVLVSGRVFDAKTKNTLTAQITYESLSKGEEIGQARSNPMDGTYKIALASGDEYGFLAQADGYFPVSQNIDLKSLKEYEEIKRDLYLVPLEVNQTIRLNNLFFDFGKHDLKPASFSELKRLIGLLREQPSLTIQLTGHTDNVGDDPSNMRLSEERVTEVKNFLVKQGVDANRLQARGYGETKPIADNKTEEGRQINRRVEFVILTR